MWDLFVNFWILGVIVIVSTWAGYLFMALVVLINQGEIKTGFVGFLLRMFRYITVIVTFLALFMWWFA